jgi:hypothetical protein
MVHFTNSDKLKSDVSWVEAWTKFEVENLSEKFSAEMEFCKIDPWATFSGSSNLPPRPRQYYKQTRMCKGPKKLFDFVCPLGPTPP